MLNSKYSKLLFYHQIVPLLKVWIIVKIKKSFDVLYACVLMNIYMWIQV